MSLPFLQPYFGLSNSLQTAQASGGVGGWVELGRTTAGGASTTMTVSSIADKRYYMVLYLDKGMAGAPARVTTFNADTGSNYAWRYSFSGAADGTYGSATNLNAWADNNIYPQFAVQYISNLATKEKLMISHMVGQNTAGAGNAPTRTEFVGKWSNTANAISSLTVTCTSNFNSGDEVVVLGWDPADTHTTNFWTELASVDLSGGLIDTNVFTAKKYLWIQGYCITGTVSGGFQGMFVGNGTVDKTTSYSLRYSINGVSDGIAVNQSANGPFALTGQGGANSNDISFFNIFVINNASNEKLFIGHNIFGNKTAGAGTANNRTECVAKWTNTSNQINRISVEYVGTGSLTAGTLKVWGSN